MSERVSWKKLPFGISSSKPDDDMPSLVSFVIEIYIILVKFCLLVKTPLTTLTDFRTNENLLKCLRFRFNDALQYLFASEREICCRQFDLTT